MKKTIMILCACASFALLGCKQEGGTSDQYSTDRGTSSSVSTNTSSPGTSQGSSTSPSGSSTATGSSQASTNTSNTSTNTTPTTP
jgi:hypothetical protein